MSGEAFSQATAGKSVTSDELDELLPGGWLECHPQHGWAIDTIRCKDRPSMEKKRRR